MVIKFVRGVDIKEICLSDIGKNFFIYNVIGILYGFGFSFLG